MVLNGKLQLTLFLKNILLFLLQLQVLGILSEVLLKEENGRMFIYFKNGNIVVQGMRNEVAGENIISEIEIHKNNSLGTDLSEKLKVLI